MDGKPVIQIPQDLTRFEDRILGPFTMTQCLILAGGAMLILMVASAELPLWLVIATGTVIGMTALLMAVVRVEEAPLYQYLGWLLEYRLLPRQRIWRRHDESEQQE